MRYLVQAIGQDNQVLVREVDAPDSESLANLPELQGCTILSVQPKSLLAFSFKRKEPFSLLLFSRELLALTKAGLSLIEAIDTLVEKETHASNRRLLESLRSSLYQGKSLSDAMGEFPDVFSEFYVATIRASERTGAMAEALERYVVYQAQADVIRKRIVSASIYPVLLIVVGGLVALFLMFYVVPRFGKVYEDLRGEIPFFSQLLMNWGKFVGEHAVVVLSSLVGLLLCVVYTLSLQRTRIWLMEMIQRIPSIGERVRLYHLSRLYRSLGMLLRGGIPVATALEMVKGLLNAQMQLHLSRAVADIREGVSLSQAMDKHQLNTPVSARLLLVGERTGEMGEMMERTAEFMDEEMARWIEWFTKLFEPMLMAFIGLIIGLIVVLMYMPIFELASNIQ